jgi:hypothetical protein
MIPRTWQYPDNQTIIILKKALKAAGLPEVFFAAFG